MIMEKFSLSGTRSMALGALALVFVTLLSVHVHAQSSGDVTRIKGLADFAGQEVTVQGRSGVIVEAAEKEGIHVFTLRDDYGDMVHVHTELDYPIMGVTLRVTGTVLVNADSGRMRLVESSRERVYPPLVTVQGQTSALTDWTETEGTRVYTLTDDYGDEVYVQTKLDYPLTGITLRVTGIAQVDANSGRLMLEEHSRELVSSPIVTIQGQTGSVADPTGSDEASVYTLTDDYGHEVRVHTKLERPAAYIALRVTGVAQINSDTGGLYLEEHSRELVRPPVPGWVTYAAVAALLAALLAAGVAIRLRGRSAVLPEPWGHLEVVSGPDQGRGFVLSGSDVVVGRQNPEATVLIELDRAVSRKHGRIVKVDSDIYYEDTDSTGGSWVNERSVEPGERVLLPDHALVRLGPHTIVRLSKPSTADHTRVWKPEDGADVGEARTRFLPGDADDPVDKRPAEES